MLELLWFIGYCREFPSQLAERIGGHPEWNRHVKYEAIKKGYVTVYRTKYRQRDHSILAVDAAGARVHCQEGFHGIPFCDGTAGYQQRLKEYHRADSTLPRTSNRIDHGTKCRCRLSSWGKTKPVGQSIGQLRAV